MAEPPDWPVHKPTFGALPAHPPSGTVRTKGTRFGITGELDMDAHHFAIRARLATTLAAIAALLAYAPIDLTLG